MFPRMGSVGGFFVVGGEVTWYGCPPWCGLMANRELFDPDRWACAVECELFAELNGACLLVVPKGEGGRPALLEVTDCGLFENVTGDREVPVVLDVPEGTFWRISPDGPWGKAGIFQAEIYQVGEEFCRRRPLERRDYGKLERLR